METVLPLLPGLAFSLPLFTQETKAPDTKTPSIFVIRGDVIGITDNISTRAKGKKAGNYLMVGKAGRDSPDIRQGLPRRTRDELCWWSWRRK
ncbi:MAG: hypothetical protein WCQ57_06140 [Verrucomicrobiota bacterium]